MLPYRKAPRLIVPSQLAQWRIDPICLVPLGSGTNFAVPIMLGPPHPRREIFVIASFWSGSVTATRTVSSASLDGEVGVVSNAGSTGSSHSVVRLPSPEPTVTGLLSLGFSGAINSGVISVYRSCNMRGYGQGRTDAASLIGTSGTSNTISNVAQDEANFYLGAATHGNTNPKTSLGELYPVVNGQYLASRSTAHGFLPINAGPSVTPSITYSWTGSASSLLASWAFN